MSEVFERRLLRAYDGERFGEALFAALAGNRTAPEEVQALSLLAELERRMCAALGALIDSLGLTRPNSTQTTDRGEAAAAGLAPQPWQTFLSEFEGGTRLALEGYEKLRSEAPDQDDPVLVVLTQHEQALRSFAQRGMDGANDALGPVREVIQQLKGLGPAR